MKIIDRLIRKLGKTGYSVDESMTRLELFIILCEKATQLTRGFHSLNQMACY